jgi:4-diphosphocytidyl-2-C-methyl-D-erythritol kinase
MILFPNAKINVGLWVVEKRNDGYHNIETLFLPIGLSDVLEFVESDRDEPLIAISGMELEGDSSDNLVMRAWKLMHDLYGIAVVDIHLHKIIPSGAGLGGGSSDAAFMLKGLNDHFGIGCSSDELESLAAILGSDCAFFIKDIPAIGKGRGEMLQPVELDLEGYELVLVNPGIQVSTRDAYTGVIPAKSERNLRELLLFPVAEWQDQLSNDFEKWVFVKYPEIKQVKEKLRAAGAEYAAMSGSGSSVFGIFRKNHSVFPKELFPGYYSWCGELI